MRSTLAPLVAGLALVAVTACTPAPPPTSPPVQQTPTPTPSSTNPSTPTPEPSPTPTVEPSPSQPSGEGEKGQLLAAVNALGFQCADGWSGDSLALVTCEFGRSPESHGVPIGLLDVAFASDTEPVAFALRFFNEYDTSEAGKQGVERLEQTARDTLKRVTETLVPAEQAAILQSDPYLLVTEWGRVGGYGNSKALDAIPEEGEGSMAGWYASVFGLEQLPPDATLVTRELVEVRDLMGLPDTCYPTMGCPLPSGQEFFFGHEASTSDDVTVTFDAAPSALAQGLGAAADAVAPVLGAASRDAVVEYSKQSAASEVAPDVKTIAGLELTLGLGTWQARPLDEVWAPMPPEPASLTIAERVGEVFASAADERTIIKALDLPTSVVINAEGGLKGLGEDLTAKGWRPQNLATSTWTHTWTSPSGTLIVTIENDHITTIEQIPA